MVGDHMGILGAVVFGLLFFCTSNRTRNSHPPCRLPNTSLHFTPSAGVARLGARRGGAARSRFRMRPGRWSTPARYFGTGPTKFWQSPLKAQKKTRISGLAFHPPGTF